VNTRTISGEKKPQTSLIRASLARWTRTAMEAWILGKQSSCSTTLKDCGAGDYKDLTSKTEKYKRYNYRII